MVSTSMLPVSGIRELSASPSRIRPGPPRLRSCRQMGTASKGWGWMSMRFGSNNCGVRRDQEARLWRGGQRSDLSRIAIEQLQAFQARRVEPVINVFGEVGVYVGFGDAESRGPFAGDAGEACGFEA